MAGPISSFGLFFLGPKPFFGRSFTMASSRHAVSVGCAPTPIQYRARDVSSLMSLCSFPESS